MSKTNLMPADTTNTTAVERFIEGMGSVLNLIPSRENKGHTITIPCESDEEALRKDWEVVGNDLHHAAQIVKSRG